MRFIVPIAPGGGADITARTVAQKLSSMWGQHFVVDNRSGGTGTIGLDIAAKSRPDGYTITFVTGSHAARQAIQKKLPYDLMKDFAPVTQLTAQSYVLVINPGIPAKTIQELVSQANGRPGGLTYGSSGQGSLQHLSGALLATSVKANLLHVPYKGGGPALVDLIAGQVQVLFSTQLASWPHIQSGRIRALAVSTAKRPASIPDLPTIAEAGLPGYDAGVWYGVLAPAGTPRDIVMRLNGDIIKALGQPDYRALLVNNGIEPIGSPPGELGQYIRSELVKWAKVVKEAGVRVD